MILTFLYKNVRFFFFFYQKGKFFESYILKIFQQVWLDIFTEFYHVYLKISMPSMSWVRLWYRNSLVYMCLNLREKNNENSDFNPFFKYFTTFNSLHREQQCQNIRKWCSLKGTENVCIDWNFSKIDFENIYTSISFLGEKRIATYIFNSSRFLEASDIRVLHTWVSFSTAISTKGKKIF